MATSGGQDARVEHGAAAAEAVVAAAEIDAADPDLRQHQASAQRDRREGVQETIRALETMHD